MAEREYVRDDHGRFAETEGAGSGLGTWAKGRATHTDVGVGKYLNERYLGTHSRKWTDEIPKGILPKGKTESWQAHFDKHPWDGGVVTDPERLKLHDEIARNAIERVKPVAPGEQKHVIMTMGGPGSGKSTILGSVDTSQFVRIDPDAIKEKLPEYQKAIRPEETYKGAAMMAHAESGYVSDRIMAEAVASGRHMVIDGTGANLPWFKKTMDDLKAAGYHVTVMMPHLPVEEGQKRVAARAEATGRVITPDFVKKTYEDIPRNAAVVWKAADEFKLFDATKKDFPLVYEKTGDGKEVEHDKSFVADFKKKHGW